MHYLSVLLLLVFACSTARGGGYNLQGNVPPTKTLSSTTVVVAAGTYAATNLTQVDTNLSTTNIKGDVTVFGVTGTPEVVDTSSGDATTSDVGKDMVAWVDGAAVTGTVRHTPISVTGQTNSYAAEDDGALQLGVVLLIPRFTVQANTNCVLDNCTGLIWARNANLFGATNWGASITNCNNLDYGGTNDWRSPNIRELRSLILVRYFNPPVANTGGTNQWTANNPFTSIVNAGYWTSSTLANNSDYAWVVAFTLGNDNYALKTGVTTYTWPVRGP